jgi:hypothetical protein
MGACGKRKINHRGTEAQRHRGTEKDKKTVLKAKTEPVSGLEN